MRYRNGLVAAGLLVSAACSSAKQPLHSHPSALEYPVTHKGETVDDYFGIKVADPYRWLEDDRAPKVETWVGKQKKLADDYLAALPERDEIKKRLTEILDVPRQSAPKKHGEYVYYYKNSGMQPRAVYMRKRLDLEDAPEQVVLDSNLLSDDGTVTAIPIGFSSDYRYLTYAVSEGGSDWKTLKVRDLTTMQDENDLLRWVKFSGATWIGDGFYYLRFPEPEAGRELTTVTDGAAVYFHQLGTEQSEDRLVYRRDDDPKLYFGVDKSDDERYLYLGEFGGSNGNSVYYKDLTKDQDFQPLIADRDSSNQVISARAGYFYLYTNRGAGRFRLVKVDPQHPEIESWQDVIPEHPEHKLSYVVYMANQFVAQYLVDVTSQLKIFDRDGRFVRDLSLPGPGTVDGFSGRETDTFTYYSFESFTTPSSVFRYDLISGESTFESRSKVNVQPDDYVTEQVFFPSKDGTRIPMFLSYKKGLKRDGTNPTVLYGYGGFAISIEPRFSVLPFGLMERGVIFARANIRGGGEYGDAWHRAGMRTNKQNVFDDFIGAAEYLAREKYTSAEHLALNGGSNGGLLVAAVMNQRPELMAAAVPEFGCHEMLRFQHFTVGYGWREEYGSSEESIEMFRYLRAYSPLHNISSTAHYPATLVITGDHDDRVVPAHSFKYIATLQEKYRGNEPMLLRVETRTGHGGGSLQQHIDRTADKFAFILFHTR